MSVMRCVVVLAIGVAVAGCGGASEVTTKSAVADPVAAVESPAVTESPSTDSEPAVANPAETVAQPSATSIAVGEADVLSALIQVPNDNVAYRASTVQAMRLIFPDLIELDEDVETLSPIVVVEVDSEGRWYSITDAGVLVQRTFDMAGTDATASGFDPEHYKTYMWRTGDNIVVDSTEFEQAYSIDPNYDLGAFTPGFSVDLAALSDLDPEVLNATIGTDLPTISSYTEGLLAVVGEVTVIDAPETILAATVTAGDLATITGTSPESMASVLAETGSPVDATMIEALQAIPVELTIDLDPNGFVESLVSEIDMSQWMIDSAPYTLEPGLVFEITQISTFDIDPDIRVTPPAPVDGDRTSEIRQLVIEAGG